MATLRRLARDTAGNPVEFRHELTITDGGPLRNVWADPVRYGWPGPGNTGPRLSMTPRGTLDTSTNGDVIQRWDVDGSIIVRGNNVTINDCAARRSVTSGAYPIRLYGDNLIINYSRTVGGSIAVYSSGGRYTLRRCDMWGCGDGPRIEQDNTVIEDCWIHDLMRTDGSHNDCIQIRRGAHCRITHNSLQADKAGDWMNGAIQWGSPISGTYDDLQVTKTIMRGGNYTLMGPDPIATAQSFIDNRFGRGMWRYGLCKDGMPADAVWTGNVWDDTGELIPRP